MRKGSTSLGSLGVAPFGALLLILPLTTAFAGGMTSPRFGTAVQEAAPTPSTGTAEPAAASASEAPAAQPDLPLVREALERRRQWMHTRLSSALATRRLPSWQRRAKRAEILKVINTRATWYGPGFHGRRTASGERFNRNAMTMASRHLPFGTRVRVVNTRTGRSAVAKVNDRGPFRHGYMADLSQGLARKIGLGGSGPVRLEILRRRP